MSVLCLYSCGRYTNQLDGICEECKTGSSISIDEILRKASLPPTEIKGCEEQLIPGEADAGD